MPLKEMGFGVLVILLTLSDMPTQSAQTIRELVHNRKNAHPWHSYQYDLDFLSGRTLTA